MQEYRDYFRSDGRPPSFLGLSSVTHLLIVANVAAFIALAAGVHVVAPHLLGIPSEGLGPRVLRWVGLVPEQGAGSLWVWQFLTYAFAETQPVYLLFNMIFLYVFGREVETLYGARRYLLLYFAAAVLAGLAHCVAAWGDGVPLTGASGAVFAVMVAYAVHYPRQQWLFLFLVPVEIWLIVTILIGLDLAYAVRGAAGYVPLAHLGGAAFGLVFVRMQHRLDAYLAGLDRRFKRVEREQEEEIEARLDTVLEKISREGMGALSKKERDFLRRASRHYQKKA